MALCSLASEFPTLSGVNSRTTRSAILRRTRKVGFKDQIRVTGRTFDHVPGDVAQWNFDSALPARFGLSGKLTDIDVDESTRRWPLRQRAKKIRQTILTIVLHGHRAIEADVIAVRSLFLDRFVA